LAADRPLESPSAIRITKRDSNSQSPDSRVLRVRCLRNPRIGRLTVRLPRAVAGVSAAALPPVQRGHDLSALLTSNASSPLPRPASKSLLWEWRYWWKLPNPTSPSRSERLPERAAPSPAHTSVHTLHLRYAVSGPCWNDAPGLAARAGRCQPAAVTSYLRRRCIATAAVAPAQLLVRAARVVQASAY
jgi:hypothetical protein